MVAIAREYAAEEEGFFSEVSDSVQNRLPALRSSDLSCIARRATDESEAGGHRYYNPLTGRFLNRDPIREAGGLNLYAHTRNDHINLWDVRGLSPHDRFTAGDNSLWDQMMGIDGRLLSDAGLRHQRYHASNAQYELWLQTMIPISRGSGTLQPRFTLRGPILRHSQQAPGGDWSGLRGQGSEARDLKREAREIGLREGRYRSMSGFYVIHVLDNGVVVVKGWWGLGKEETIWMAPRETYEYIQRLLGRDRAMVVAGGLILAWPGDDPKKGPEGTEWRGPGEPGSKQGNYYNP